MPSTVRLFVEPGCCHPVLLLGLLLIAAFPAVLMATGLVLALRPPSLSAGAVPTRTPPAGGIAATPFGGALLRHLEKMESPRVRRRQRLALGLVPTVVAIQVALRLLLPMAWDARDLTSVAVFLAFFLPFWDMYRGGVAGRIHGFLAGDADEVIERFQRQRLAAVLALTAAFALLALSGLVYYNLRHDPPLADRVSWAMGLPVWFALAYFMWVGYHYGDLLLAYPLRQPRSSPG